MTFVFVILGIVLLVLFLIAIIKYHSFKKHLLKGFANCSTCVYGKKRQGKDVLFSYVIKHRKEPYYANLDYGYKKLKTISLLDLTVSPNTYENLIAGEYTKIKRTFYEGVDYYISDIGNIAPSQYDALLHKKYPSLPIFQSLSGHLYDSRIHVNAQTLNRIWKPIREQADFFIRCRGTRKLFGFIFITFLTTYEKLESAEQCLYPLKKVHFNKFNKADLQRYYAVNGDIREGYIISFKWQHKYDSRAFEKLILKGKRKIYNN